MDDLYHNLDNFKEQAAIEELQEENKELKCKLKEYASTLEKLQKDILQDFDKLNMEYKNLEFNYSSLLKTAKAEIERKTQIITNLNIEKDQMVLKSFNKKNAAFNKSRANNKSMVGQNCNQVRDTKCNGNTKIIEIEENRQPSPSMAVERKEQDTLNSKETNASPQTDITSKLLNMANCGLNRGDPRIKNSDAKENVLQSKKENDTLKSRALIRNRRKSMPALSLEIGNFSTDDDDDLDRSTKDYIGENVGRKHVDGIDRGNSKISNTSSLEDRTSGFYDPFDTNKSRHSRHNGKEIDRYRLRDKSSHRYRKQSPDWYKRGSKEFHSNIYHKSEYDRHRATERVLQSPLKDKYHWRPSHEMHRETNYERNHRERLQHRSQERYAMKHKIQRDYDESDSKRMKVEMNYKQNEECRLQEEREFLEKKHSMKTLDSQFSSCESPDYIHPDVSTHQIKEIKLTATAKLDDPRISNTKYVLKMNNGKNELSTVEGRNVKIEPINKKAWVSIPMPEALKQRPKALENEKSLNEIHLDIENPVANISIESGEILDPGSSDSQYDPKTISNKSKNAKSDTRAISVVKCDDIKNIGNLQKINSYKIPKIKKTEDRKVSSSKIKETNQIVKSEHENTKSRGKIPELVIKNIDKSKQFTKSAIEKSVSNENKHESFVNQSNNELPNLGNSDLYDERQHLLAKNVVEGDLELSDDNFDNNEQSNQIVTVACIQLEKKTDKDQDSKNNTIEESKNSSKRVSEESCRNKTIDCAKKIKSRKKSKHKETKEELITKESVVQCSAQVAEKTSKKKGKEKRSKTVQIKTKFSELFDDSSSLISPEDLGLATVSVEPTTQVSGKCAPFFDDALDEDDLNAIKTTKDLFPSEKSEGQVSEEYKQSSNTTNEANIGIANTNSQELLDKAIDKMQPEVSVVTENVYKNLQPDVQEEENNVVTTVIISTGVQPYVNEREKQEMYVQPQLEIESEKQYHADKIEPQISIAGRDVDLKALATSTPHKMWLSSIEKCNNDAKLPNLSCNSIGNESSGVTVENTAALDNSDSNTFDSKANDVPDVRIYVRRRRKVIKKI